MLPLSFIYFNINRADIQCLCILLNQYPLVVLMASAAGLLWDLMRKIVKFYNLN